MDKFAPNMATVKKVVTNHRLLEDCNLIMQRTTAATAAKIRGVYSSIRGERNQRLLGLGKEIKEE